MPALSDDIGGTARRTWLRYLAAVVLAVVFLIMSFLGGLVQRITAEVLPAGTGGLVVAAIITFACAGAWLMWRGRKQRQRP